MVWLIVAAHAALGWLLARLAVRSGASPSTALWYLAIPGFMSSLMSALPESLAACGMVAGLLGWRTGRHWLAALGFGAGLLVRETGLILVLALLIATARPHWPWKRGSLAAAPFTTAGEHDGRTANPRPSILLLAVALLPFAAWRLYVAWRLFPAFGWTAALPTPGDFGVPFAGLIDLWLAGARGLQPPAEVAGALVFPIVLAIGLLLAVASAITRPGPVAFAGVGYGALAVALNYQKIWSHLPSGERATFELFVCLLVVMIEGRRHRTWVSRSLVGMFGLLLVYTFGLAPDASTSRAALLVIR
jgi:hypothetical protein